MNGTVVASPRWACHLHKSSNCEIGLENDRMFHIVPVKETTIYAQKTFNERTENDEFWEALPRGEWYTPYAYSNQRNEFSSFKCVMRIFEDLDSRNLIYTTYSSPSDFIKSHIITDGRDRVYLCNKHLLQCVKRKSQQTKYTSNTWIKNVLKSMFPRAFRQKNIPTNIPVWALELLRDLTKRNGAP